MKLEFRKLKANEIDIRVGNTISSDKFKGATLLLYKDARVDMALLDETVGPMNWQREHSRENANCKVGIFNEDRGEWIWKEDTGTESFSEAEKGLASDSFKRACVNWGIGRELYTAKNIIVSCELQEDKKTGKMKPVSGLSWFVKEIGCNENGEINKLVIFERYRKEEKEVYRLGGKVGDLTPPPATKKEFATPDQLERMRELQVNEANVCKRYKVAGIEQLSKDEAEFVITSKEKALRGE